MGTVLASNSTSFLLFIYFLKNLPVFSDEIMFFDKNGLEHFWKTG